MPPTADLSELRAAVAAALDDDDPERATAAVRETDADVPIRAGEGFREVVATIPPEYWRGDPRIAVLVAASYRSPGCPTVGSALAYLRVAETVLHGSGETASIGTIEVWVERAAALRNLGRLDEAAEWLERTRSLALEVVPDRIDLEVRRVLERGLIDLLAVRSAPARAHLEYANGLRRELASAADRAECVGALALIAYEDLDLERSERLADEAESLAVDAGVPDGRFIAPARIARLFVAIERHDTVAIRAAEPAALAAAAGTVWEIFALAAGAYGHLVLGEYGAALDRIDELTPLAERWRPRSVAAHIADMVRAGCLLATGQVEGAWALLSAVPPGPSHELCPARTVAEIRLSRGDLSGARRALEDCEALGGRHSARTLADVRMIQAAIHLEDGNTRASDLAFEQSVATMARTRARAPLRGLPSGTLRRLALRAAERTNPEPIRRLVDEILAVTADQHSTVERLSQSELRVLGQMLRGRTVAAIASELYLSPNTVKTHLRSVYRKLGVSTRHDAIRTARALGVADEITRDSPAG